MEKALTLAKEHAAEIEGLIAQLRTAVDETIDRNVADPKSYGYAANLGYATDELRELLSFLKGTSR